VKWNLECDSSRAVELKVQALLDVEAITETAMARFDEQEAAAMTLAEIDQPCELTDTEARAAAREMWRVAEAAGEPITGAELGRAFGKTDPWGRKQIERARSGRLPTTVPAGMTPLGPSSVCRSGQTHRPERPRRPANPTPDRSVRSEPTQPVRSAR
jgi:hypothetical protein